MDQPEETTEPSPDEFFLTAVIYETALGLLALLLGWMLGPDPRALIPELSGQSLWPVVTGILYGVLAAVPMLLFMEGVRRIPWEPVRELERLTDDSIFGTLISLRPVELVVISLCAGVGEELLFRGWMMSWIAGAHPGTDPTFERWMLALVGSSIAFGLVHYLTRLYVLIAALMGVYFGFLMLVSENLLVPIAAHATYNAVLMIMAKSGGGDEQPAS